MVASIDVLPGGFDGSYHMKSARPDYYTKGGDPPGQWTGSGASALQLSGTVQADEFRQVLAGRHPRRHKSLVQRQTRVGNGEPANVDNTAPKRAVEHRPGFDLCFSAPKSLSAFWAVSDPSVRKEIEQAMDIATRNVLHWAEANVPLTRRGKAGRQRELARLVVATFDHVTNRNEEPMLHRHCVVANVCQRRDGSWATIDSKALYAWTRTLGPMFRCELAAELRQRLGLKLVKRIDGKGNQQGWFEVDGVPRKLIDLWSSRRAELTEALEGKGHALGGSSARAREAATLTSRRAKGCSTRNRCFALSGRPRNPVRR